MHARACMHEDTRARTNNVDRLLNPPCPWLPAPGSKHVLHRQECLRRCACAGTGALAHLAVQVLALCGRVRGLGLMGRASLVCCAGGLVYIVCRRGRCTRVALWNGPGRGEQASTAASPCPAACEASIGAA